MSRHYEGDDCDPDEQRRVNLWRANLAREIKGKRGQAFLRELLAALEALPEKRLVSNALAAKGTVCALGSLALKRRTDAGESSDVVIDDLSKVIVDHEHEDWDGDEMSDWAEAVLACPSHLAWYIPYENDTGPRTRVGKEVHEETDEHRYERMVRWVRARIVDGGAEA